MSYIQRETSRHNARPFELYTFEFGDSVYRYTSADSARTLKIISGGNVIIDEQYEPEAVSRTVLDQSSEDGAGSIVVTLPVDNPVAALFAGRLPGSRVALTIHRAHTGGTNLSIADWQITFTGTVTAAMFDDGACQLTCSPLAAMMTRVVPTTLYQPQCNHTLFSQTEYFGRSEYFNNSMQAVGCGVKKQDHRLDATLSAVAGLQLKSAAFATKPNGHFTNGHIELPGGDVRWIESHAGDTLTLSYPADITAGAVVAAYPGCDLRESTCRDKFNNVINFSGFTRMPNRNPFDTRLT